MTTARATWSAVAAMVGRDFRIFTSYKTRVIALLVTTLFTITLFHFMSRLVHAPGLDTPEQYYAFVIVGLVILEVLTSTLALPARNARQELVAGTFERLAVAPAGTVACVAALMAFPFLLALATGLGTLLLAGVLYGLELHWSTAALGLPVAFLGAAAFAPFGMALLGASVLFKQTVVGASFIVSGVSLVAGIYFPVSILPGWLSWAAEIQPFTPAVDLMRHVLVDTPPVQSPALEVFKLVAFAAIGLPLGAWLLSGSIAIGRRRATLLEY